jgi:hypothetical protein
MLSSSKKKEKQANQIYRLQLSKGGQDLFDLFSVVREFGVQDQTIHSLFQSWLEC